MGQEVIKIRGGQTLKGEVNINGAKIVQLLLFLQLYWPKIK